MHHMASHHPTILASIRQELVVGRLGRWNLSRCWLADARKRRIAALRVWFGM